MSFTAGGNKEYAEEYTKVTDETFTIDHGTKLVVTYLTFLIAIGQDLEAVCGNGQKLYVVTLEKGDHLLKAASKADGHLGPLLVEQQIVEGGDCVEQHRLHG